MCSPTPNSLSAISIHFPNTHTQLNSKDIFDIMLLEQSTLSEGSEFTPSLGEGEELSPPTLGHPRLAMLDAATVLQITSQTNLTSVKASLIMCKIYNEVNKPSLIFSHALCCKYYPIHEEKTSRFVTYYTQIGIPNSQSLATLCCAVGYLL